MLRNTYVSVVKPFNPLITSFFLTKKLKSGLRPVVNASDKQASYWGCLCRHSGCSPDRESEYGEKIIIPPCLLSQLGSFSPFLYCVSFAIGCPCKNTWQLVHTVDLAKCRWINVDISLSADPRLPLVCSPQWWEGKKEVLKCQSVLPLVMRQEHGGNMESWGFSRLKWNEAARATLNLFGVPFCSFGAVLLSGPPSHHWLPSGQKWKMDPSSPRAPARNSLLLPPPPAQYRPTAASLPQWRSAHFQYWSAHFNSTHLEAKLRCTSLGCCSRTTVDLDRS